MIKKTGSLRFSLMPFKCQNIKLCDIVFRSSIISNGLLQTSEFYRNILQDKHYISFKHFIHCSDVSIVEFEEKNPGWVYATSITGTSLPDKPSI